MKSSRYTSTWDRAVARACGDKAYQFMSASSISTTSYVEVFNGLVSARSSRWCSGVLCRMERVSSVSSLTVLVVAQKKAEGYTYPMGIER